MGMTTMGVKLDDATRERIKTAATRIDRTPHWLIKQAIFNYLERLESDEGLPELRVHVPGGVDPETVDTKPVDPVAIDIDKALDDAGVLRHQIVQPDEIAAP